MSLRPTKGELAGSVGRTFAWEQSTIFDMPAASRKSDPITSKIAGKKHEGAKALSKLQREILGAFRVVGAMTDETLENLPIFKRDDGREKYARTTVRCRRSALFGLWLLVEHGLQTNSNGSPMTRWALAPWSVEEAERKYRELGRQELRREAT